MRANIAEIDFRFGVHEPTHSTGKRNAFFRPPPVGWN